MAKLSLPTDKVSLILNAIIAVFSFPEELRKFIKLMQKSDVEKRQVIDKQVDLWMQESAESERPVFDHGQKGFIQFFMGFAIASLMLVACAGAEIIFPYKWFHVSPAGVWEYPQGKLLSEKQEDDKPLSFCRPTKNQEGKDVQQCVVMPYAELNLLISDYKGTKQQLIDCKKELALVQYR